MRATAVVICLFLLCTAASHAEPSGPLPELIVNVGNVKYDGWKPSGDSVIVSVFLESVVEDVGAFDLWISLDHNVLFEIDTVVSVLIEGTAIEDWETVIATVIDPQQMILRVLGHVGYSGTPPIPAGAGSHLLFRLIAEVRDDALDPDSTVVDSLCESPYYETYGETIVYLQQTSKFFNGDASELIGYVWEYFCVDSTCIEWDGDQCVEWECSVIDSNYVPDTSSVILDDGSITLICEYDCDQIGDADGSGWHDIDDVVYLINFIFMGGPSPIPNTTSGDWNCDCQVDIDDVVDAICYIFIDCEPVCDCDEWILDCILTE